MIWLCMECCKSGEWTEIGQTDWCTACCVSYPFRLPPFSPIVSASRGAVPTSEVWHGAQREHGKKHPLQLPRHAPVHGQIQPERSGGRHNEPKDWVRLLQHHIHSVTFTCFLFWSSNSVYLRLHSSMLFKLLFLRSDIRFDKQKVARKSSHPPVVNLKLYFCFLERYNLNAK